MVCGDAEESGETECRDIGSSRLKRSPHELRPHVDAEDRLCARPRRAYGWSLECAYDRGLERAFGAGKLRPVHRLALELRGDRLGDSGPLVRKRRQHAALGSFRQQ